MSHKTYWQRKLARNFDKKNFPYDYKESALNKNKFDCEPFEFPQDIFIPLATFCADSDLKLYKILVSGIMALLSKFIYNESNDIIVGGPARKHTGKRVNIVLPIKTQVNKNQTFKELFILVGQTIDEAYENEDQFMEVVSQELNIVFPYKGYSLFDVAVSLGNLHNGNSLRFIQANMKFLFQSLGKSIEGLVEYNVQLYQSSTIKKIIRYLVNLLHTTLANINIRLVDIDILDAEDKKQLLLDFNNTNTDYPANKTINEVFQKQVEKGPDCTAVIYQNAYLSYNELNRKANCLAFFLQKKCISRDEPIGIMAERSLEMIAGLLGILKAGGAYLPINFDYPESRKKYMLRNANLRVLLTLFTSQEIFIEGPEVVDLHYPWLYRSEGVIHNIPTENNSQSNNAAYILFTSGSSGKPKGVIVEHRGVIRLVKNTDYIEFKERERILQTGALEFDASTFEIWGSLLNGLTLCLTHSNNILIPGNLKHTIQKYNVDMIFMTSSLLNQISDVDSSIFSDLNYLLTGGDVLSPVHINRIRSTCRQLNVINCYGPTENTTISTTYRIAVEHDDNVPIGKPIANSTCYIVDENLRLLPLGVPGELIVGGDGVARGYLNQPELTAEKFIENRKYRSYGSYRTYILYKTGDLARWLPDVPPAGGAAKGIIEFLGRIDQQVKIRGFRIEPGEIENHLLQIDPIKEAIVIVLKDPAGEKYLCAYMTAAIELDITGIREKLTEILPGFMIPSYFVQIDKIPLNTNGKIDRNKLPDPMRNSRCRDYIKPREAIEEKLVECWADVLNYEKDIIGIDDDFFQLGGHSLKAAALAALINKTFHVNIPISWMFQLSTIQKQAGHIKTTAKNKYLAIEPAPKKEYYRLTSAQKRIYFMTQMDKQGVLYNNPFMEIYQQFTDKERIEAAFKQLIERHESLRTTFHLVEGEPIQKIHDYNEVEPIFKIEYKNCNSSIDYTDGTYGGDDKDNLFQHSSDFNIQRIQHYIQSFIRPFDLSKPLLIRVGLITLIKSQQILMMDIHHIISDGVSLAILLDELYKLYNGESLKPLIIQYKDFSEWSYNLENKRKILKQEKFWLNELAGEMPVLHLPIDYPRPLVMTFEGDILDTDINTQGLRDIYRQAQSNEVTLFMILFAVFNVLSAKLSSQEDIIIGTVTAGRGHTDLQNIIGMFVNTLALRNYPIGQKAFKEFLLEIKETTLAAFENQEYPFELLVSKIASRIDASRNPLFDVAFELHNESDHKEFLQDVLILGKSDLYNFNIKKSKFELSLIAIESHDGLFLKLEYNSQLFKKETAERFLGYYKQLLISICQSVGQKIAGIEMIPEIEKNKLLYEFNNVESDYPQSRTIHSLVEEQGAQKPGKVAVIGIAYSLQVRPGETGDNCHLTYREMNKRASQLDWKLRTEELKPGDIVAIMVEPSLEMFIGLLGILKAGGAFLPIKDGTPIARINYILQESRARFLFTRFLMPSGVLFKGTFIYLDDPSLYTGKSMNLAPVNTSSDIAYGIYTSGSTGKPKGVMIEHRSLVNLCTWHNKYFEVTANDRATKYASFGFDASVIEIFPYLVIGATIYIVPEEIKLDVQALNRFYEDNGITISFLPTQVGEQFITIDNKSLRVLQVAGDRLKVFVKRNYQFYNCYGPTENTVCTTCYPVTGSKENIPIGKPIANNQVYILDINSCLQPIGVPGELCIGGDGVARGYLNQPELTAEKFIENRKYRSYGSYRTYILYKTGDLARWLPDDSPAGGTTKGIIEFLGRIDQQVKIRGFRIELGEIEQQLLQCKEIKEAVVLAREDTPGQKHLCAYIVPFGNINIGGIKDALLKNLPDYMIPSYFCKLEKIPITPNGKIDALALPPPGIIGSTPYEAPTNEIEEILVQTWEEVLGVKKIGIHNNFFEMGGDSIKIILITSKLFKWRLTVNIKDFFLYPTIQRLARHVIKKLRTPDQIVVMGKIPLTPIQCWFFENHLPYGNHFNQSLFLTRRKGFNENYIKKMFAKIVSHHDALRMVYKFENGNMIQENRGIDGILFDLVVISLKSMDQESVLAEIKEHANQVQRSMDLQNGPLLKLRLFRGPDAEYLLIVIHHLVIDGVSWRILLEDFEIGYQQMENGEEIKFQDKTDSFQNWALKLTEYAGNKLLLKEIPYWKTIDAADINHLPVDHEIEADRRRFENSDTVSMILSEEKTRQLLTKTNWAYNTEINDILLAALGLAVKQWARIEKFTVRLEGHGREQINVDVNITRTVGWFTIQYPVLLEMGNADDIAFTIKNVKETLRRVPKKGIGHGILQYITPPGKKESFQSKFIPEILFNYLGEFGEEDYSIIDRVSDISAPCTGDNRTPHYIEHHKIDIEGIIMYGQLNFAIFYNKCEYERKTIERLAEMLETNLVTIIDHCLSKKEKELTPSDLGYHKISLPELARITGYIKDYIGKEMEIQSLYPVGPMQSGMLFHWLKDKKSATYFEQIMITFRGKIHPQIFEEALNTIAAHYDAFRTIFTYEGLVEPLQIVLKKRKVNLQFEDIIHLNKEEQEKYLEEKREKDRQRGFDLTKDYLTRFSLFKTGADIHIFIWSFHHTLMDGWCLGIIRQELIRIYRLLEKGESGILESLPPSPPSPPYIEYVHWLEKQDKEEGLLYWKKYLEGYEEPARLPQSSYLDQAVKGDSYRKVEHQFVIAGELAAGMNQMAAQYGITVNTFFQTIWGVLLQRYNNRDDVVFGAIVSGRPAEIEGIEQMVGLFINMVPVRIKSAADQGILKLLEQVQTESLEAKRYEYLPAAEVQSQSQLKSALIDHILIFENYYLERQAEEGLICESIKGFEQTNYDFNIIVLPWDCFHVHFSYNSLVYDRDFVENIALHFEKIICQAISSLDILIKDIDILSEKEKEKLLFTFNNTKKDYSMNKTIHCLFAEQVEKTPDQIALIFKDKQLDYIKLNEKANQVAHMLRQKGVCPDTLVGIMVARSMEMIIGLLGILKAGGAYIPIDPEYPFDRVHYMIKDSNTHLLLTQEEIIQNYTGLAFKIQTIDIFDEAIYLDKGSKMNPPAIASPINLAYAIYTSGSTGKPKGVVISHFNAVNFFKGMIEKIDFTPVKVILAVTTMSFDIFLFETLLPLTIGLRIVIAGENQQKDPTELWQLIGENEINLLHLTPSRLRILLSQPNIQCLDYIKEILVGGEVFPPYLFKELKKVYHGSIINGYGPTETTVFSTLKNLTNQEEINIGKPIANTQVYIIDRFSHLQSIGVPGELCIDGNGVARGYLNQPELTAEKFIENRKYRSYGSYRTYILYKTGDLARWLPDGNIEFLGRIDQQVKIRGFRIELGEIENELLKLDGIKEAVVLAKENENWPGEKYLCAYFISGKTMDTTSIRNNLVEKLPAYMIPTYFLQVEKMPLTPNGKLDRKALPDPNSTTQREYIPPTNKTEKILAGAWEELLNKKISIHDNLFEIGGDSIKIILIAGRLQKRKLKININDFFKYPTIHNLAQNINNNGKNYQIKPISRDKSLIAADIKRDYDNYLERVKREKWPNFTGYMRYKNILITGAAGYLGAHIAHELLQFTNTILYLPIRANSQVEAETKLKEKMAFYFGPDFFETQQHRLMIIKSDLAEKKMGLSSLQYKELSGAIDTVVHSAAKVKHFGDYREFYKDNVEATEELLEFAGTGKEKTFHHISTLDTGAGDISGRDYLVYTEYDHDEGQKCENVYVKSKFETEKRALAYQEKGLNTSIYRVGNITFHSETGCFQENIDENFFYSMLKALIKVGFWAEKMKTLQFDLSFVNLAARAIVLLLAQSQLKNETYHICNPHILSWLDMEILLKECGIMPNEALPKEVQKYLAQLNANNEYEKIIERIRLYSWIWEGKAGTLTVPKMDRTIMLLEKLGFRWPKVTKSHIEKMINHCNEVGFITFKKSCRNG